MLNPCVHDYLFMCCTPIYPQITSFIEDIINHSAGWITSFHMIDAVVRGMFTPCNEIAFTNTNTNTISCVLCIANTFVWCLVVNSSGETVSTELYPEMLRNVQINVCRLIWTFWILICSDYHLNSIYIYYCYIWLVGFWYVIMYTISLYCKCMCIYMYSYMCTWYTEDMFKLMYPRLKMSLSIL